jgi:hypothetical protein
MKYQLMYRDPATQRLIVCETGPRDLIESRLKLAKSAPGNTLEWKAASVSALAKGALKA